MSDQFDPSKPARTRDGRAVRIYATDAGGIHSIHGAVLQEDGLWSVTSWAPDGKWHPRGENPGFDLVNITPDVVRYIPVRRTFGYDSASEALDAVRRFSSGEALVKVTFSAERGVSVDLV